MARTYLKNPKAGDLLLQQRTPTGSWRASEPGSDNRSRPLSATLNGKGCYHTKLVCSLIACVCVCAGAFRCLWNPGGSVRSGVRDGCKLACWMLGTERPFSSLGSVCRELGHVKDVVRGHFEPCPAGLLSELIFQTVPYGERQAAPESDPHLWGGQQLLSVLKLSHPWEGH